MARQADRIAELEDALKRSEERVRGLRNDLTKADELVNEMREQVEDGRALIESWIEAFEMELTDSGWTWSPFIEKYKDIHARYTALVRQWNAAVGSFNSVVAHRNIGRPLAASEAQRTQVLKLHKAGKSLRAIVEETSLGFQTVRTIVAQGEGRDRTTIKHYERIGVDRREMLAERSRKRARDILPKQINETLAKGRELVKEAKGLK
jgi:DNA repair exonuclease SbcCD ATPase subunit